MTDLRKKLAAGVLSLGSAMFAGCETGMSPREEYLLTRSIEIYPTPTGPDLQPIPQAAEPIKLTQEQEKARPQSSVEEKLLSSAVTNK